jgi:predicted kinase
VQRRQPAPLVIVSGAPGSGKTTLATRLSQDLGLPMLDRDALKEALADAIGHPADVDASARLGAGSSSNRRGRRWR